MSRRTRIGVAATVAALLVALGIVWAIGSSDPPTESAANDGYLGLKLLLEREGATVSQVDGGDVTASSAEKYDVVFVLHAGGVDRAQLAEWHRYMAAGGRLVLGEPDTERPADEDGPAVTARVAPGTCTIEGASAVRTIHAGGIAAHHIHSNEQSCFGNQIAALVTSATCQQGAQFTLSSPTIFDNATMGAPTKDRLAPEQRGNAQLAALLLAPGDTPRVGIVTDGVRLGFGDSGAAKTEPKCADTYDDDALWQDPGAAGPSDSSTKAAGGSSGRGGQGKNGKNGKNGTTVPGGDNGVTTPGGTTPGQVDPSGSVPNSDAGSGGASSSGSGSGSGSGGSGGSGQQGKGGNGSPEAGTAKPPPSIFDFMSPGLKLALAQLLAVLVWFAWRRSRRRGVLVEDEKPVELRSSRLVEAVGSLRRRGGETERSGQELRERTRQQLASSLGLGPDAGSADVAAALAPRLGRGVDEVGGLLLGPPVETEDDLVALAAQLHALRAELAATLTGGRTRS